MTDKKELEEKESSVNDKKYYIRLGITIVSFVVGTIIIYYAISPLHNCKKELGSMYHAYCDEVHSW